MHKHGGDIYTNSGKIDFSANINPLGMPKSVSLAAKNAVDYSNVYPDVNCSKLKKAISIRENVGEENIICGNGAAELIFAVCMAKKPKNAVLICPSFEEYRQALEAVDCEIANFYLKEENNFKLDEEFLDVLTPRCDIIFVCNPNNPTGQMIEKDLFIKIVEKCLENDILLVADECFNDFISKNERYTVKGIENTFILKAFTKMYAMAGIRLGYGICSNTEFLKKIQLCMQPWNVSVMAQAAGVVAAQELGFAERTLCIIEEEKEYLLKELSTLAKKIYGYSANYIFFKEKNDFADRMLLSGIIIRNCSNYQGLDEGFFRIAIKGHEDNVKLIEAWKKLK
ncbi:MAG: histidinol-phosphate transaminase [Lachnospiraceae bacterium]|nr:histidinol-phosphate transaminase [Lachnospiraceae bacterium]